MNITEQLITLADEKYALFQGGLIPTIQQESILGVRVPVARSFAREIYRKGEYEEFFCELPHCYYDENVLHGLIIAEISDYDTCVDTLEKFLPFVDNWAVCDIISPKCFKKNKEQLLEKIMQWANSDQVYTCRFGLKMLMTHFLDADFQKEFLEIPASIHQENYYVKMMIAWFFATALAKQWDATVPYLEQKRLETWIHNKTIQKAVESYRITTEQKTYLKSLKNMSRD